jgi:glutamine cyclotransferase
MHKSFLFYLGIALFIPFISCNESNTDSVSNTTNTVESPISSVEHIPFKIIKKYVHAPNLFTQGLQVHNGVLYESTGSPEHLTETETMIGISNLEKGSFVPKVKLDKKIYFGEGITILNDKIYQITYLNQEGFVYDLSTFKKLKSFKYSNKEGWGLTNDGNQIIMSDGTNILTYWNPETLAPVKTVSVTEYNQPLQFLNELEFINGYIYANVWMSNYIVKIDPQTGNVVGKMDLAPIVYEALQQNPRADVLNGIAYDKDANKIYITGKLWHHIYELELPH